MFKTNTKKKMTNENKKIEIGFNIQLQKIIKKGFVNDLNDYAIINKESEE